MTRPISVLAALLVSWAGVAYAPPGVDLALLREVICTHETRGVDDPSQAVGWPGQEIGRCQIKPTTARQYAGEGEHLATTLQRMVWRPEPIADVILADCSRRMPPHLGAYGLAARYNQGCGWRGKPRGRVHDYARQVASDYAAARLKEVAR